MQTTINTLIISLLSKETLYISGIISLEELHKAIQDVYKALRGVNADDSIYELVRGLAAKYEAVI
ncbi:hypothetical protein AXI76_gp093 [Pseudoalteromonas phage H101]|uniref:Uncharacterized protein n=1 Tax=Pseudoalteromonas phage H101 TaxID=1654919 RepID=A0A0H4IN64_9CAUD|nr:hypothetical protein AXI76_gp093 [Pseudoalteromonas phage H101]AKO60994.1 hypothetical protein [Pseudoalteromonas phage H101]